MAEYEIIIFLATDKIQAIEVDKGGNVKNISFNGNKEFIYNANEGINPFYDSLTDTYSVDEMSDIDSHIYVVDCGAESSVKWALADKIRDCNGADVISINKLLPLVISRKDLAEKGKTTAVSFMGNVYVYSCNDDMKFEEISADGETNTAELQVEDFGFLAVFDAIGGNNAELEKKIADLMTERKEKEGICAELQKQVSDYSSELETLKKRNEELEKWYEAEQLAKNRKNDEKLLKARQIISVNYVYKPLDIEGKNTLFKAEHSVSDGKIILSGTVIGGLISGSVIGGLISDKVKKIIAPKNGKVAWLNKHGEVIYINSATVHVNSIIEKRNRDARDESSQLASQLAMAMFKGILDQDCVIDVAIIGDENDDVDAMIEWYWEQREAEKIKEKKA